jgi:hypothetical protein
VQVYAFFLAYLGVAVLLILFPLTLGLTWLFPAVHQLRLLGSELAIDIVLLVGLFVYLYLGLRRAYQTSSARSAINAGILSGAVVLTIIGYHTALFYLTFWTT